MRPSRLLPRIPRQVRGTPLAVGQQSGFVGVLLSLEERFVCSNLFVYREMAGPVVYDNGLRLQTTYFLTPAFCDGMLIYIS